MPDPGGSKVSDEWQQLYDAQYGAPSRKREVAARQTVDHIRAAWHRGRVLRMLDVGAGEGSILRQLDREGFAESLYAVEVSSGGVQRISAQEIPSLREVSKFDGYNIPYADDYFDVAYSTHVLEHVEHERSFLREISRVAKVVIIEVPLEDTMRAERAIRLCRPHGHINFYSSATLRNLFETSDLSIDSLRIHANSVEYEQVVAGRLKGRAKFAIRAGMLKVWPGLASRLMTYNCIIVARRRAGAVSAVAHQTLGDGLVGLQHNPDHHVSPPIERRGR